MFQERVLTVEEVVKALCPARELWLSKDPKRRAVVTVSPVRHMRNGLQGNALSKATLRVACSQLYSERADSLFFSLI